MRNEYFTVRKGKTSPWPIFDPKPRWAGTVVDHVRFALQYVEERTDLAGLRFYVTHDVDHVPAEGDDVVVICVGEERGLIPRYSSKVRAVFKSGGDESYWFDGIMGRSPQLSALLVAQGIRNAALAALRPARKRPPNVFLIPIGMNARWSGDPTPVVERPWHVFYDGRHQEPAFRLGRLALYRTAKDYSRARLLEALQDLEGRLDGIRLLFSRGGLDRAGYIRGIRESAICIAPRGNFVETARLYEVAREGCVVITEPLPETWYLRTFPGVIVRDWRELEPTIRALVADPVRLEELSAKTRRWWEAYASEEATGRYIYETLRGGAPPRDGAFGASSARLVQPGSGAD